VEKENVTEAANQEYDQQNGAGGDSDVFG